MRYKRTDPMQLMMYIMCRVLASCDVELEAHQLPHFISKSHLCIVHVCNFLSSGFALFPQFAINVKGIKLLCQGFVCCQLMLFP